MRSSTHAHMTHAQKETHCKHMSFSLTHTHTYTQYEEGIQEHKDKGLKCEQGKDKTVKQTKQYEETRHTHTRAHMHTHTKGEREREKTEHEKDDANTEAKPHIVRGNSLISLINKHMHVCM